MYAVIADSGKQFYVQEGQKIVVDFRGVEPGETIEFERVLLVGGAEGAEGTVVGQPTVAGAKVVGQVVAQIRGEKIQVGTYKKRKNYRRHKGHRQPYTEVLVQQVIRG